MYTSFFYACIFNICVKIIYNELYFLYTYFFYACILTSVSKLFTMNFIFVHIATFYIHAILILVTKLFSYDDFYFYVAISVFLYSYVVKLLQ